MEEFLSLNSQDKTGMFKKGQSIAIIPARAGSKTIPGKNIKLLKGKPLISYSIKHALESNLISEVYVSSDSEEILAIAKEFGAKTILRPQELANDIIMPDAAILHAIQYIAIKEKLIPECTLMLQPTSPIRKVSDINNSIESIISGKFNSVISAYRSHHLIWSKEENTWESNYGKKRPRRQDLVQFTEDGSIYAFNTLKFVKEKDRIIKPVNVYEIDQVFSLEIDTQTDWRIIENLFDEKGNLINKNV